MRFTNVFELERHLYSLSIELHTNIFEIVPVQLIASKKAQHHKPSESKKRKRSEETDSKKRIRLQKVREFKTRKQSEETDSEKQKRLEIDYIKNKSGQKEYRSLNK